MLGYGSLCCCLPLLNMAMPPALQCPMGAKQHQGVQGAACVPIREPFSSNFGPVF